MMIDSREKDGPELDAWGVQDEVDDSLRKALGPDVPFETHVREYESEYHVSVVLTRAPKPELVALASALEGQLSQRGRAVKIEYEQGEVVVRPRRNYENAQTAFDEVWRKLTGALPSEKERISSTLPVRDFIYLDVERLASLFAQCREGLTTLISLTEAAGQAGRMEGNSGTLSSFEVQKLRGETNVLHDYMYRLVEIELGDAILPVHIDELECTAGQERLRRARMCRVDGRVELQDFQRMTAFVQRFNDLAEAIAYSMLKSSEFDEAIEQLRKSVSDASSPRKNRSRQPKREINAKGLAAKLGLLQDQKLLKNIELFTELFYKDAYEVLVKPKGGEGNALFRAPVNRSYLRIPPERLRALYGFPTQMEWTLVGSVTYVSRGARGHVDAVHDKTERSETEEHAVNPEAPSMRDPYHQLFQSMYTFENMFIESHKRIEVMVFPLAIYRNLRD